MNTHRPTTLATESILFRQSVPIGPSVRREGARVANFGVVIGTSGLTGVGQFSDWHYSGSGSRSGEVRQSEDPGFG